MGEIIDFVAYRNKKFGPCPVCGDGQNEPCLAECFGIETDEED